MDQEEQKRIKDHTPHASGTCRKEDRQKELGSAGTAHGAAGF